jgi:hypothetical protein
MYTHAVMEQGTWAFIKGVFKKSCSVLFGKEGIWDGLMSR